jgi:Protein of unknown function (DUF4232)
MRPISVPARTFAASLTVAVVGLLAGCGAESTVTVTAPQSSAPAASSAPGASSAPTANPATTPAGAPGCATSVLTGSLGPASGAAGSSYYPIRLTNTSSSACTLYGYPGVSFVTASGGQVGAAATEDPVYPRQLVTLAPGGTAHADLQVTVAQNYPAASCSPVTVHRLKVYPPGQTSALFIPLTSTGCANPSVKILSVQTVRSGSGS